MPPQDATRICRAVLPLSGTGIIALSTDAALLSVASGTNVCVYSTRHLVQGGTNISPLRQERMPAIVTQLAWRPSSPATLYASYVALLETGSIAFVDLLKGTVSMLQSCPEKAASVSWSPDGSYLAVGHGHFVSLCSPLDGSPSCSIRVVSEDAHESDDQSLEVDGISYISPKSILVTSRVTENGELTDLAPACALSWTGDAVPITSDRIKLSEFFSQTVVVPHTVQRSPRLLTASVPDWGAVVYTHSQANDDHIKVVTASCDGNATAADVTDDRLAIRIPNAAGYEEDDNFVVGLGIDLTATGVIVQHPTDETAPDLPAQPLLWVATSDGVFRAYTFGSLSQSRSCVTEPRDLPPVHMDALNPAAAVVRELPESAEDQAAATELPDDDSDFAEEEDEVEKTGNEQTVQVKPEFSFGGPPAPVPSPTGFSSASAAITPSSPPGAFNFGAPVAFGASPESKILTGAFAFSEPVRPSPAVAQPSPVLPLPKPSTTQPPIPSIKARNKAQELQQSASVATSAPRKPIGAVMPLAPAGAHREPSRTATPIPDPDTHLQGESDEVAALERDFLKSLLQTRKLEAELHDAVADAVRGAEVSVSINRVNSVLEDADELRKDAAHALNSLISQRKEVESLSSRLKLAYIRMEAMPAFADRSKSAGNGGVGIPSTADLIKHQPLDPSLSFVRDQTRTEMREIALKLEEVHACLSALEERQRRGGGGPPASGTDPRAQVLALYDAVNAQTAVIQAQTVRLEELAHSMQVSGSMPDHPSQLIADTITGNV